jgi:hypothetical protein
MRPRFKFSQICTLRIEKPKRGEFVQRQLSPIGISPIGDCDESFISTRFGTLFPNRQKRISFGNQEQRIVVVAIAFHDRLVRKQGE